MVPTVIRWKLKEVMDDRGIRPTDLAKKLELSRNAISNLRGREMPRMDGTKLNALVLALNSLRRIDSDLITPGVLIEFSLTTEEMKEAKIV